MGGKESLGKMWPHRGQAQGETMTCSRHTQILGICMFPPDHFGSFHKVHKCRSLLHHSHGNHPTPKFQCLVSLEVDLCNSHLWNNKYEYIIFIIIYTLTCKTNGPNNRFIPSPSWKTSYIELRHVPVPLKV